MKKIIRSILLKIGLLEFFKNIRRNRANKEFIRKYRKDGIYTLQMDDRKILFSTSDFYSLKWFYPRYEGSKIHEEPVIRKLILELNGKKNFSDVGTNLGYFTCIAGAFYPHLRIDSFELDPDSIRLLRKNVELNKLKDCHINSGAVSDINETIEFYKPSRDPSAGLSMTDENKAGFLKYQTKTIILDDYYRKNNVIPEVIKIDVEGAEMGVLRGMKNTLSQHKPILFLEIHPVKLVHFGESQANVTAFLRQFGYQLYLLDDFRSGFTELRMNLIQEGESINGNLMIFCIPG